MSPLSSEFLRKRGSCCKSNCLHCPYGRTLREVGVIIHPKEQKSEGEVKRLMDELVNQHNVSSSLLDGAFGKSQEYFIENAYLLSLKDITCGLIFLEKENYIKHFLLPDFDNQGIDETYLRGLL